jgi:hypothetical protein
MPKKGKQVMADWASIGGQVATVGINILGSLLGDPLKTGTYTQGDIIWMHDNKQLKAYNNGDTEVGISYALSSLAGKPLSPTSTSTYQPIEAHSSYDATKDLSDFSEGNLCIGKVLKAPSATLADVDLPATVSFAIAFLSIAVSVKIINGITLSAGKNLVTGLYELTFTTTGPKIQKIDAKADDTRGGSISASASFSSGDRRADDNTYTVPFPSGVDLSPLIQNLSIALVTNTAAYIRATEESRRNLVKGDPRKAHQPAGS